MVQNPFTGPACCLEDHRQARAEAALAGALRQRAAAHNRRLLESWLAHRIQELAHGGRKPEMLASRRWVSSSTAASSRSAACAATTRPVAGAQVSGACHGVEHVVTLTRVRYEYGGQPCQSLSAIVRAITGTR